MDIQLAPKKWYVKYRALLIAGALFIVLVIGLLATALSPSKLRISAADLRIAEVVRMDFVEYVNADGTLQPIQTIKVNTKEAGIVERIVAEEGSMLQAGDTILILSNVQLERTIDDERDAWSKQYNSYRERLIQMEQQSLTLRQQTLQTAYDLRRLEKQITLSREEYRMGIKSKAELELAEDEYAYRKQSAELQMKSLLQDSAMNVIRREMLEADLAAEQKKLDRSIERLADLVITAPISGQLSSIDVTPGKQIGAGTEIGEVKIMDRYKLTAQLNEYYVDKLTQGQPATITYEDKDYGLVISKIVPEVRGGTFSIEMLFADSVPDNARIGKSYQTKIELSSAVPAVLVPKGNFYPYTGGRWIYRLNADGTRATRTAISVARQNPLYYEVIDGLQPGDRVITAGYDGFGEAEEIIVAPL